ncbi:MAG: HNH endonuclease, partial [Bacteroidota bacterium]|nr:HNH endonuclease [Bacteroidota bacterium]
PIVEIKGKGFRRDNVIIAKIKYVRGSNCQLCGTSIKTKNGTEYIEAAHIEPKYLKGKESLSNIILLCPNHHKEFDLGDRRIETHTDSFIKFALNGKLYCVELIPNLSNK